MKQVDPLIGLVCQPTIMNRILSGFPLQEQTAVDPLGDFPPDDDGFICLYLETQTRGELPNVAGRMNKTPGSAEGEIILDGCRFDGEEKDPVGSQALTYPAKHRFKIAEIDKHIGCDDKIEGVIGMA